MKHIKLYEQFINEDKKKYKKGDKLKVKLKNGKEFDITFDSYSSNKGIAFGKIDGDKKPFSLDAVVDESVKHYKQFLAEAQSVDIQYALKDIKNYNNGKRTSEDLTFLAQSITKNLGYKTTTQNIENVENHLIASETPDGKIPEDKTLIKELYPLLESYDGNLSDLKYEFPLIFQQETQWSPSQIKLIKQTGSSYTVKITPNITKEEMEKVGTKLGLKLISYKQTGSTIETIYK